MMESSYFKNGNFQEYSYFAGEGILQSWNGNYRRPAYQPIKFEFNTFRFYACFLVVFIRKMATTGDEMGNRSIELNPALDFDLDEIDDKEFDIPRVDKPPTLESILNAPDEDLPLPENCIVDGTLQVGDTPTSSRSLYSIRLTDTNLLPQNMIVV